MLHNIPVEALGPQGAAMAEAVTKCVHCGFCLATCPTYKVLGEEMDSPRGRIVLMKEMLEGQLDLEAALPFVDRCLGCMACVTACPSGVPYGHLLSPFRARAEAQRTRPFMSQATRLLVKETLPYPDRFRAAVLAGKLGKLTRALLPAELSAMLDLLPAELPKAPPLPEFYPAEGKRRARVALLAGCVQQVLAPEINWATLRVLARNGVETVIPQGQGCCGSLSLHIGEGEQARTLARRNLAAFPGRRGCHRHQRCGLRLGDARVWAAVCRRNRRGACDGFRPQGQRHQRLPGRAWPCAPCLAWWSRSRWPTMTPVIWPMPRG